MIEEFLPFCFLEDCNNYSVGEVVGRGSYGCVVHSINEEDHNHVAIKHIPIPNGDTTDITKKTLRELRLLNSLRHDNILSLVDVKMVSRHVYVITEYCDYDLSKLNERVMFGGLCSINLSSSDYLYILFQLLQAITFIHSVGVLHRDIKPSNILLNSNLTVKLCDFGLARVVENGDFTLDPTSEPITEYMVTRWYRAPEVVLNPGRYGKAQDIWAAGCTFCEFLRGSPLLPGKTAVHQLQVIVNVLGDPTAEDLDFDMPDRSRRYITSLKSRNVGFGSVEVDASLVHPLLAGVLRQMLQFNPRRRVTASTCLQLPIFSFLAPKTRVAINDQKLQDLKQGLCEGYRAWKLDEKVPFQRFRENLRELEADIKRARDQELLRTRSHPAYIAEAASADQRDDPALPHRPRPVSLPESFPSNGGLRIAARFLSVLRALDRDKQQVAPSAVTGSEKLREPVSGLLRRRSMQITRTLTGGSSQNFNSASTSAITGDTNTGVATRSNTVAQSTTSHPHTLAMSSTNVLGPSSLPAMSGKNCATISASSKCGVGGERSRFLRGVVNHILSAVTVMTRLRARPRAEGAVGESVCSKKASSHGQAELTGDTLLLSRSTLGHVRHVAVEHHDLQHPRSQDRSSR